MNYIGVWILFKRDGLIEDHLGDYILDLWEGKWLGELKNKSVQEDSSLIEYELLELFSPFLDL